MKKTQTMMSGKTLTLTATKNTKNSAGQDLSDNIHNHHKCLSTICFGKDVGVDTIRPDPEGFSKTGYSVTVLGGSPGFGGKSVGGNYLKGNYNRYVGAGGKGLGGKGLSKSFSKLDRGLGKSGCGEKERFSGIKVFRVQGQGQDLGPGKFGPFKIREKKEAFLEVPGLDEDCAQDKVSIEG